MRKLAIIGMSHIEAVRRAWPEAAKSFPGWQISFLNLKPFQEMMAAGGGLDAEAALREAVRAGIAPLVLDADAIILSVGGNEHNVVGLFETSDDASAKDRVRSMVTSALDRWVPLLATDRPTLLLMPPPPIESERHIREHPGVFRDLLEVAPIRGATARRSLWEHQNEVVREYADRHGLGIVELPGDVVSSAGMLMEDCIGHDPTHGNSTFGLRLLAPIFEHAVNRVERMAAHPYIGLPNHSYWKSGVARIPEGALDPVVSPRFLIGKKDKVATAGSCFAQHISRRLRASGFNFLISEAADSGDAEARGFFDFSARYGNIYTARQLRQLFDRAFGRFAPIEDVWERPGGGYCDPFRPRIEPEGFPSPETVRKDAENHLAAVRQMFLSLDVFVFTLGLTECWLSGADGAAFPIAPGVAGGRFDPAHHKFVNFKVNDVVADLRVFIEGLMRVNAKARVLLTVSPVPLAATREQRHVLVSTAYSKAVLRVAAEQIREEFPHVEYFPSFEIITGPHSEGRYFGPDRRGVTEAGVDHVMRVFMARMTEGSAPVSSVPPIADGDKDFLERVESVAKAACDEELYDTSSGQ